MTGRPNLNTPRILDTLANFYQAPTLRALPTSPLYMVPDPPPSGAVSRQLYVLLEEGKVVRHFLPEDIRTRLKIARSQKKRVSHFYLLNGHEPQKVMAALRTQPYV